MGNKLREPVLLEDRSNTRKIETQLTISQSNNQESFQEVEDKEEGGLCCIRGKTVKKKVKWETRFIANCQKIRDDLGYVWINNLLDIVRNNELPKLKYLKEVHNLRKEKPQIAKATQLQLLSRPEDLQKFKKNLKKSVIISFSQHGRSTIQLPGNTLNASFMMKRSRFENIQQKKNYINGLQNQKKIPLQKRVSANSRASSQKSQFLDNKEVSKLTATELQIFLKFSTILQRHLGEINCILGRLRKQFVYYFQQKFKDPILVSRQLDLVIETVQVFIAILNDGVMNFYNLKLFAKNQGSNMFISNEQNISSSCTAILFRDHQFYNCLFNCISYSMKERQQRFNKIINFLAGSGPQRFQVKDRFCLNTRTIKSYLNHLSSESQESSIVENIQINDVVVSHPEPYKACMIHLNQMAKSRSPINKLKCLMSCSQGVTAQIQKFYQMNSLRKQKFMLDADQMLSIFCYLIVGAKVQHLHTHLFLLDNFATSQQIISMTGYYLSVMHCAVQQLQNEYGKEIGLHNEMK